MMVDIFHNFENLLSELENGESGMFDIVLGRFAQFCRKFHWAYAEHRTEIESAVFTSDVDENITQIFRKAKHL